MLSILSSIANTIISLVSFLVNTIKSFIDLLVHLPDYLQFLTNSLNLLPSVIIPFGLLAISIYVILFIMGRKV